MEIIQEPVHSEEQTSVALGYFDGVHAGHQAVITEAVTYGRENGLLPTVFTLQQSPRLILFGEAPGGILPLSEKLHQFELLGVERVYLIDFRAIRHLTAEEFVEKILIGCFHAAHAGCGFNYHFGSGAAGNGIILSQLCQRSGISETTQPRLCYDGLRISSTRIRQCIADGDITSANAMLGRRYSLTLPVIRGRQLGRTLGFPTLNQSFPDGLVRPRFGAYVSEVTVGANVYRGVTDIGVKPTVGSDTVLLETWLPEYHGPDLYDQQLTVSLLAFIRPERRFDSLSDLRSAVSQDALTALHFQP